MFKLSLSQLFGMKSDLALHVVQHDMIKRKWKLQLSVSATSQHLEEILSNNIFQLNLKFTGCYWEYPVLRTKTWMRNDNGMNQ